MTSLTRQILASKRERRRLLSELSYSEKVRIVEKLRDASKRISAVGKAQGLRAKPKGASSE